MKKVVCVTALVETSPQALPLGAACIVSAIKSHPSTKREFDAELFSFSLEDKKIDLHKIAGDILSRDPYAVGFSVYVWNRVILEELCDLLKSEKKDLVTFAGGPEITAHPEVFASRFDHLTSGAGEIDVPLFLSGKKNDGSTADFELVSPYLDGTLDPSAFGGALWELARGCPFKCSYCYESKGEKRIKYFSEERLSKELDFFAEKKIPQVFVLDPTYNANRQRALKMLRLIKEKTPDTFYYFEARAEFIDRDLARAFAEIPCSLQFGLQSSNENVLKNVNRSFNKKQFVKNIGLLNESGAIFGFDLIWGLPGDSYNGFKESIDFAVSLYPNNLELFCLSVLPGTTLFEDAPKFALEYMDVPPYNLLRSPTFSEKDMAKAKEISDAVNVFYTQGRAVTWFNAVLYPLRMKASVFFEYFAEYMKSHVCDWFDYSNIEKAQLDFVKSQYLKKNLKNEADVAHDLIVLNNALSEYTASGKESVVELNYHPDDLMSEYAQNIKFFAANCGRYKNRTRVFDNDWKVLKI